MKALDVGEGVLGSDLQSGLPLLDPAVVLLLLIEPVVSPYPSLFPPSLGCHHGPGAACD